MNGRTSAKIGITILVAASLFVFFDIASAFGGFSAPTDGEWYNISWHYRIRVEINTTNVNTTDWPVEMSINFTDLLPNGTFDNHSVRVLEYNLTGKIKYEVPSQFDSAADYNNLTNAAGELVFIMNGTTPPNAKRIFYVYFDVAENGAKTPPSYSTGLQYGWDGQIAMINTTKLEVRIDTNRGENTSGIYFVRNRDSGVPIITNSAPGERTAEYLEFFNGTNATSFDLSGNATFVSGPVRLTLIQGGEEVFFNTTQRTWQGRILKKYHFYNRAGPQSQGSFIKISSEFIPNGTVSRSSNGTAGLDVQRTFLGQDIGSQIFNISDPFSWIVAQDSIGSVAGVVNLNETSPNYFATNTTNIGRIGISLTTTSIPSPIKDTAMFFFATGGSDGVSEFFEVRNSSSSALPMITNLTEKLVVVITPEINSTFFNLNETILIRGNVSNLGDAYSLVSFINATLDMGTAPTGDDVVIRLFDDGTNGDVIAGDRVFTNNYTFSLGETQGEWKMNLTAYDNILQYLNSTIFIFNVTNVYYVNITLYNAVGVVSRQVIGNVSVMNFNRTAFISGALLNCSFSGTEVVNKTDNGNGIYSINFTAPATINTFSLFCNATKYNNTGNDTEIFTTEPPKTSATINATPSSVSLQSITLYANETFTFSANITNTGIGTARDANITLQILSGWAADFTFQSCGNIAINSSCLKNFNVTVQNATPPGNYTINVTAAWTNPDDTQNTTNTTVNVTVLPNPKMNVSVSNITGTGADGTSKVIGTFLVLSVGNDNVTDVMFNCTSGVACTNFSMTFSPVNITSLASAANRTVSVVTTIALNYTPGSYNGTINVSGAGASFLIDIFITLQNKTNVSLITEPTTVVVSGVSIFSNVSFPLVSNVTNLGNSSARNATLNFTLPAGWIINTSIEVCSSVVYNTSCFKNNTVTVPNGTTSGNYTLNISLIWINLDSTNNSAFYVLNVTVAESPAIGFDNSTLAGDVNHNRTLNLYNLTIFSVGASTVNGINLSCTSGVVCANFSPTFLPSFISALATQTNATVAINVTIPYMFHDGVYTGVLNISSINAENKSVTLVVTVLPNRTWTMTPASCKKSMFPDEGKVCDVNISNTGNTMLNFTIITILENRTSLNATNFSIEQYNNYTFSVLYNVTGVPQNEVINSTYVVSLNQTATPQNLTLNISLLPSTPPTIVLSFEPLIDQMSELVITANITDATNSGINFANITVTMPNGTTSFSNMSLVSTAGNLTIWRIVYANVTNTTFGNTTLRGVYNISVYSTDNLGNIGNKTGNFTVRLRLNIVSNTLASQYVQGDTGTMYYSVRNISNAAVQGVNVSFWLYDPNMTLIYTTNRTTDSLGTFAPLPVFSLASDAPVGNYILVSNSTYTDNILNLLFTVEKNYTFTLAAKTIVVTGLFSDIETAVVWFPNNIMRFNMLVYDGEGKQVDPDNMTLVVLDPAQNNYFSTNLSAMTKRGVGYYAYSFAMPVSSATGMYLAVLNLTRGSLSTMKLKAFRVAQGGPYDVRLALAKSEVEQGTPLDFTITIENKGEVTQDVFVNYTITSAATGDTYYTASEAVLTPAFTNQSFTRSAFIFSNQPLGNYLLKATVKYDNTQPDINASTTFIVLASRHNVTQPPSGGGGGGSPVTGPALIGEAVGESALANSITIEKYNKDVRTYPGFKKIESVIVKNTGKSALRDVSLTIVGLSVSWYNVTPGIYSQMLPENSTVFLVEYNVPADASAGDYKFSLVATASTTSDQKSATLHVVGSISDLIIADINQLKEDLKNLLIDIGAARSQGKNVDEVLLVADEAQKSINKAEINYNLNNTQTALDNIKEARILIDKARGMLDKLETVVRGESANILLVIILIAIPLTVIIIAVFVMKKKNIAPKRLSDAAVHLKAIADKIRLGKTDVAVLAKEKEKLSRMLSVLEKERKESIVSEDSYNEMKKSIESKLQKIGKKIGKA